MSLVFSVPSLLSSGETSSRYPCCVQETFLAETCYFEADAWFLQFYQVLECEYVEIVDVGVALPDVARRKLASRISTRALTVLNCKPAILS